MFRSVQEMAEEGKNKRRLSDGCSDNGHDGSETLEERR